MPRDPQRLDRVRQARVALSRDGPVGIRGEGDFERVALPADDADVLRDVLVGEGAQVVVEVGLGYGSSALAIGEALHTLDHDAVTHVIIDAYQDQFGDVGWKALVQAGVADSCRLLRDRSLLALPRLLGEGFTADAAFVDGSHIFHNVFVDLVYVNELVRLGGLVILDDCHWPSVGTAARYFELHLGWRPEPCDRETRLRAFRLPNPRLETKFEDFRPFAAR